MLSLGLICPSVSPHIHVSIKRIIKTFKIKMNDVRDGKTRQGRDSNNTGPKIKQITSI